MHTIRKFINDNTIFVILILLFSFFSFYAIGRASINNDAQLWYSRSQNFVKAIHDKDWEDTFQNPKPGVTVMWLSGFSLETFLNLYTKMFKFTPDIYTYDTFYLVHSSVIVPLIVVVLVSLVIFYIVSKNFVSKNLINFALLILIFQPLYVGLTRNFHADAAVTAFMTISALLYLYYYLGNKNILVLVISSVTTGLALLSKSSAIFLLPFFIFISLLDFIYFKKGIKTYLKNIGLLLIVAYVTFYILFPAMWVDSWAVINWVFIDEGLSLMQKGRDGINSFWYYLDPLTRTLTFSYIISFLTGLFFLGRNFKTLKKEQKVFWISTVGYVFFYLLQMSLVKQKMDRYILPIFPLGALIGGYGLNEIYTKLVNSLYKKAFLIIVIFFSSITLLYYFPNYLLFPSQEGKDQFGCSLCAEVGDYLNNKPNGPDLKIISLSKKLHRLQPFVKGKVYSTEEKLPNNWTPEYVVGTVYEELPIEYQYCVLEKVISFRGVSYWNLYSCKN